MNDDELYINQFSLLVYKLLIRLIDDINFKNENNIKVYIIALKIFFELKFTYWFEIKLKNIIKRIINPPIIIRKTINE